MIAEICNGRYCEENGYFCPFMDRSGTCIATSCKYVLRLLEAQELERRAEDHEERMIFHYAEAERHEGNPEEEAGEQHQ